MIQDRRNLQVHCHNDHSKQYAANLLAAEVSAVVIAMPLLLSNAMQSFPNCHERSTGL